MPNKYFDNCQPHLDDDKRGKMKYLLAILLLLAACSKHDQEFCYECTYHDQPYRFCGMTEERWTRCAWSSTHARRIV